MLLGPTKQVMGSLFVGQWLLILAFGLMHPEQIRLRPSSLKETKIKQIPQFCSEKNGPIILEISEVLYLPVSLM